MTHYTDLLQLTPFPPYVLLLSKDDKELAYAVKELTGLLRQQGCRCTRNLREQPSLFDTGPTLHIGELVDALPTDQQPRLEQPYWLLTAHAMVPTHPIYKRVAAHGAVVAFPERKPWDEPAHLAAWSIEYLAQRGVVLPAAVADELAAFCALPKLLLHTELDKLVMYMMPRKEVTIADIHAICTPCSKRAIWELYDVLSRQDTSAALAILHALASEGVHPLRIVRSLRIKAAKEQPLPAWLLALDDLEVALKNSVGDEQILLEKLLLGAIC